MKFLDDLCIESLIRNREAVAKVIRCERLSSGFNQKAARNWQKLAAASVLLVWFVWLILPIDSTKPLFLNILMHGW